MQFSIDGHSRHKPLDPAMLAAEASDGLDALADAMDAWLKTWVDATTALGVEVLRRGDPAEDG